jgi:hypothetical protein
MEFTKQNKIDQRSRDYAAIKALCKGADMDKCPLVLKTTFHFGLRQPIG